MVFAMEEMYFTITECSHYFATEFLKEVMKLKLEKEPDNKFDSGTEPFVKLQIADWRIGNQCRGGAVCVPRI